MKRSGIVDLIGGGYPGRINSATGARQDCVDGIIPASVRQSARFIFYIRSRQGAPVST